MAPVKPVSTAVAATGLGLKYVGGRTWAAWSGQVITNNSTETALEFDSPDTALKMMLNWATDFAQMGSGHTYQVKISLNEEIVWRFNNKNEAARASADWDPIFMVIPAYSKFKLEVFCETSTDLKWTFNLIASEL